MTRFLSLIFWGFAFPAVFTFATEPAQSERQKLHDMTLATLDFLYSEESSNLSLEEKQTRVQSIIEAGYDLKIIVRRAIGRHWHSMSTEEQEQVLKLFKQLVIRSYLQSMDATGYPEFEFGPVIPITDKRIRINSGIQLNGRTYQLGYHLGLTSSGWQLYDIHAEGVSIISNYRSQMNEHFRNGNGAELIVRLKELLDETP